MSEIITNAIEIQSGVISSGLTVDMGGEVTVLSGGTVTDAEAVNYGYFWVEEGGYISNIRITNSGDAMLNGGLAENLTMESGGQADIFGGTMRTGTILNGGYGAIYETGSGLDVAVSAGGRYLVYGGYAENTIISSGGSFTVQMSGGLADKTTIEAGGHARIVSGGEMRETILNGARLDVISGTIKATTINGGELHISSGGPELASGYAENTFVNGGSFIVYGGVTVKDTTVNKGLFMVSSDVTADGATVNAGAGLLVLNGGTAAAVRENGGYVEMEDESDVVFASNTFSGVVLTNMSATVHSGTTAHFTTLNEDAVLRIYSGGEAYYTTMNGGTLFATSANVGGITVSGGYASFESTAVSDLSLFGGTVFADSATVVSGAALNGGVFRVQSGTIVIGAEFNGADIVADPGAVFSGTILKTGHVEITSDMMEEVTIGGATLTGIAGAFYAVTVDAGIADFNGSLVFSLTVNGGTVFADSDSIITGALLNKGGTLSVRSGTLVTGCEFCGGTVLMEQGAVFSSSIVRSGGDVTAQDGEIYRTVAIDQTAKMYVQSGASVSDAVAVKDAELIVQSEGVVSGADVVGGVVTLTGGTALDISLGKTTLPFSNGLFSTPSVVSYGSARLVADRTAVLRISSGGLAVGAYASEGNAGYGSEYVGIYVGDGGVVSNTTIDKAVLYVSSGGVARDTKISGYYMAPIGGYVLTHYPTYGKISVLSGGYAENIDMNQAILKVSGGTVRNLVASNWSVIDLSEGGVIGGALELTGSAKLTLGSNGGTIDFDISETAPGAAAVKKGLSLIEGAPLYTLTVSDTQETGIYHLATDSPSFAGAFTVRSTDLTPLGTLTVGGSVLIGDLYYTVKVRNVNVDLIISTEAPPLEDPFAVYVDSAWSDKPFGSIVELAGGGTATIGYDAFADGDEAVAAVKPGGVVYITGGAVSFADVVARDVVVLGGASISGALSDYDAVVTLESGASASGITVRGESTLKLKSGSVCRELSFIDQAATVKVESGATISGAYFAKSYAGITIDGTIEFDLSKPGTGTPLRGLSMYSGTPTCVITVDAASLKTGQYILASDMSYKFGQYSYTVRDIDGTVLGVIPAAFVVDNQMIYGTAEIGDFRYTISYKGGVGYGMGDTGSAVSLSVEKIDPDKESYVYLNASWKDKAAGESVTVTLLSGGTQMAIIGQNAFAVLDDAVNAVAEDGTIAISYTKPAQSGIIVIGGGTATVISGTDVISVSGETASGTGGTQTEDGMIYSFPEGLPRNIDLIGTGAKIENALVQATLSISNAMTSNLSVVEGGGIVAVSGATCISVDVAAGGSFLCRSSYNLIRDLHVVSGGTFGMYNDVTIVVGSGAREVSGTCVFESGADITINGTVNFDLSGSTAGGVLFDGLKYVKGNTQYRITVGELLESGLYHLAVNANEITDGITLYVKNGNNLNNAGTLMPDQTVWVDGRGFLLTFADGALDLMVIAFEPQTTVYLNAAWDGLEKYSVVEVPGGTAVLGIDAFADLMPAMSACADDGSVIIEGGTYTFSGTVEKNLVVQNGTLNADSLVLTQDLTLDAGTVLIGGLTVSESYSQSQSGGSIVCSGSVRLNEGATAAGTIVVNSKHGIVLDNAALTGTITVNTGGILSGRETFTDGMDITVNGYIDFDISGSTAGEDPLMRGLSRIKGSPTYTLTVDAHQEAGTYWLADDAAGFNGSITIRKQSGAVLGTLTAGKPVQINGTYYTVRGTLSEGKMQLYLLVGEQTPPETVYLSTDWRWTGDGSLVEVPSGTANIGYDAFYSADDAIEASLFGGSTIEIIRGMYSFTSDLEIPGDVVVNGGTLSVSAGGSRLLGNITVNRYSLLILEEGASLGGSIVLNTGGSLTLKNGMAVSGLELSEWSTIRLGNGSSASSIRLLNNGRMDVDAGGLASGITVEAVGGTQGSLTVYADGFASDVTVQGGRLTVKEGGTASDITVYGGNLSEDYGGVISSLTVAGSGSVSIRGKLTGRCSFGEGANIIVGSGDENAPSWPPPADWIPPAATINFDLSYTSVDGPALYEGFSRISYKGTPAVYTLTASASQENGDYLLANGVTSFADSITVSNNYGILGTLAIDQVLIANGAIYMLGLEDGKLNLSISGYVPPEAVYLNAAWTGLQNGKVVSVSGGTAIIGYDAFSVGNDAVSAAGTNGTLTILGGTFTFTAGILPDATALDGSAVRDSAVLNTLTVEAGASVWNMQVAEGATLTVRAGASASNLLVSEGATLMIEAGGKLTGWGVFSEGANITVDGTLDFDISTLTAASSALYEGLSYVQGDTAYTLTVRAAQTPGFYYLAYGAGDFKSAITIVGTDGTALGTLRAGISTRIGDALYTLNLGDGILSLSIAPAAETARSDIDGNGISDVLFQYTGGDYQTGYWMNGKDTWLGANMPHSAEWTLLGAYDMDGDGIADSVFVGNTVVNSVKGAYIGYYKGGVDTDDNWMNIHFLENEEENVWANKIGNLTGNNNRNSIVWHCAGLGALGVWTDGTSNWVSLGAGFDSDWTMVGCGDFDGDGRDSVVMSYMGGVKYYAIGIDGSAVDMGALNWSGWETRAIGDFAGDGKDDMVLFHKETGVMVKLADGSVDNYTVLGQLAANDWFVVGAGDYDGDKKDDLLVRQYSTGMLGYYSSGDTSKWVELGRGVDMDWTVIA